jgi:hypothetical protein
MATGGNRMMKRIGGLVVAGAVALGIGAYQGNKAEDSAPKVGECAKAVGGDDIKKVDCSDPEASLLATTRAEDTADGEAACASDVKSTSYYRYENRGTKFVVCFTDR